MPGSEEKERRHATRFSAAEPAAALTASNPEALPAIGQVVNISGAGMFLNLDRELDVGTRLSLVFTLPAALLGREQDAVVWCKARVVRLAEGREGEAGCGAIIEEIQFLPD
ncbi:MAG: PilZ domain-containing protein [Terriglobia bacterium]